MLSAASSSCSVCIIIVFNSALRRGTASDLHACQSLQHTAPGHYAAEAAPVVHYRDKVLLEQGVYDLLVARSDAQRRAEILPDQIADTVALLRFERAAARVEQMPQEVALRYAACVFAVLAEHGYGGVAVMAHDLKPLTHGVVGAYVGGHRLGG